MLDSLADLVQCSSCGPCDCESGKGKNNSVYSRWAGRRDPTIPGPIRQPGKKNGSDSDAGSKASSVPELSGGTTNQQQDSRTCSEDTDILTSLMAMVKAGCMQSYYLRVCLVADRKRYAAYAPVQHQGNM